MEVFKAASTEYREVVCRLTGYRYINGNRF
jgi:hypothetical protein